MSASSLRPNRQAQFWILQFMGWTAWVLLLVMRDLNFVPAEYMLERTGVFVIDALVGVALSTVLRFAYAFVWDMRVSIRIATVVLGCLLTSLIWQPIKALITETEVGSVVDLTDYGLSSFIDLLPFSFSLLLSWSVLYFCIKYYQLFQVEKEKSLRSEALAHEAQLRMLRYQLNPHFLFNTLNAISTLVLQRETDLANTMLTRLSKFLRYSLDNDPLDQVPLAFEIASVKLYLEIEKVRFDERMKISLHISPQAERGLVPSMLLQPLVENCIKHAIARNEAGGMVQITAAVEQGRLLIHVEDDGPGVPGTNGQLPDSSTSTSGVGLKNIHNRLREIYGAGHAFTFAPRAPRGCKVTVDIPYETE
jgi:two-component system, LytTR family, sensor kinase